MPPDGERPARQPIVSDRLAPTVGPYSVAIRSGGLIHVSGLIALDPETGSLAESGVERQTERIFANLALVLEAAGKSLGDVVRAGVYLADMGDFAAMNRAYARHFAAPYPARTTIGVAALPLGARVEIDFVIRD
jgi:2-iminobutanoate/2-iminopropanoate deaminase